MTTKEGNISIKKRPLKCDNNNLERNQDELIYDFPKSTKVSSVSIDLLNVRFISQVVTELRVLGERTSVTHTVLRKPQWTLIFVCLFEIKCYSQ